MSRTRRIVGSGVALTLVFATMLLIGSSLTAPASAAGCRPTDFTSHIRRVTGTGAERVYRLTVQPVAARTVIYRSSTHRTSYKRTLYARVGVETSADAGASATLKKVVNIFLNTHFGSNLTTSYRSTTGESAMVSSHVRMTIAGGSTLLWFKARHYVAGTYQQSACRSDGNYAAGTVVWHTHTWSSFGPLESGAWKCTLRSQTPGERAAKRAGCLKRYWD